MPMIKIIINTVIFCILLSVLCHFIYPIFPNPVTSIFFPVNESIWEHMKLITVPIILASVIEYILYKVLEIPYNNFILSIGISSIFGIMFYLILYLPIIAIFKHNFIIAVTILLLTFIFSEFISFLVINNDKVKYSNLIGFLLIIINITVFAILTYNPPKNYLFYDTQTKSYDIQK